MGRLLQPKIPVPISWLNDFVLLPIVFFRQFLCLRMKSPPLASGFSTSQSTALVNCNTSLCQAASNKGETLWVQEILPEWHFRVATCSPTVLSLQPCPPFCWQGQHLIRVAFPKKWHTAWLYSLHHFYGGNKKLRLDWIQEDYPGRLPSSKKSHSASGSSTCKLSALFWPLSFILCFSLLIYRTEVHFFHTKIRPFLKVSWWCARLHSILTAGRDSSLSFK